MESDRGKKMGIPEHKKHIENAKKNDCFLLNRRTGFYHHGDCKCICNISPEDLENVGRTPWKHIQYTACPYCCQDDLSKINLYFKTQGCYRGSKSEIIGHQLENIGHQYGMNIKTNGGTAYVTTVAGEWIFRYNDRPIVLNHRNTLKKDGYHLQPIKFSTPVAALSYIYHHDFRAVQNAFDLVFEAN